jgi:hypothetical protein
MRALRRRTAHASRLTGGSANRDCRQQRWEEDELSQPLLRSCYPAFMPRYRRPNWQKGSGEHILNVYFPRDHDTQKAP